LGGDDDNPRTHREVVYPAGVDRNAASGGEIYTIHPDRSHLQRLTRTAEDEEYPDWSPDGRWLTFNSDRELPDQQHDIYVMRRHGSQPTRLTTRGGGGPVWSPNGQRIAFVTDSSGDPEVWTMRADGRRERNRTAMAGSEDFSPDWQPLSWHERAEEDDD
jgi:Tol biopolymer transport system component